MKADIKKRWVEALRGGKYQQGFNALHREGTFCCLGVLTDLYLQEMGESWVPIPIAPGCFHAFGKEYFTPDRTQKWAGLECGDPDIEADTLSLLNDGGKTFKEIADLIEKYIPGEEG